MAWKPYIKHTVEQYMDNVLGWPRGFFEEKTAEELGLTEDERNELIEIHRQAKIRRDKGTG